MISLAFLARADRVGYFSIYDCKAENELLYAEHHDWSKATRAARWKMISTTKDVFTSSNSYARLVVRNKRDQSQLFRVPTPALTHLWISQDSRFIVGISNTKLDNPIQVVVFNTKGMLVLAKSVDKEPQPQISIETSGDFSSLHIEGNSGVDRVFTFKDIRE
jgi:hypothetical protein